MLHHIEIQTYFRLVKRNHSTGLDKSEGASSEFTQVVARTGELAYYVNEEGFHSHALGDLLLSNTHYSSGKDMKT